MFVVWLACASAVLGHNPDTSYARVKIGAQQVETRLTYDIFTLLTIVELDEDQDGRVTRTELTRQAPAIQRFLRDNVWLAIGMDDASPELGEPTGFVWPPDTGDAIAQQDYHAATGLIHFAFVRPVHRVPEDVTVTFDFFQRFGERHTVLGTFAFDGDELEVTFDQWAPNFIFDTSTPPPLVPRLWRFFVLGMEHIFLGYDHICFLIALLVVSQFRELLKIVTSFTVAHSITLILASLDVINLPSRLVECGIAATIIYVAVENFWVTEGRHRWLLTFVFGLVHGCGFASVLREMGLPTTGLIRCLISFNVGVEVGQIAIAAALLPISILLRKWKHGRTAALGVSVLLALFGLAWLVDRALSLEFMPF